MIQFDDRGLLAAIVQDADTGRVLMHAYMDKEALKRTLEGPDAWLYSRSRQELWHKGGTSGHTQKVESLSLDCDGDAVLMRIRQHGAACHKGYRGCFYRTLGSDGQLAVTQEKTFDPNDVYGKK